MRRTELTRAVKALARSIGARATAAAERTRLDALMTKACAMRAAGQCSAAELDQAAAVFARSALAIAKRGAC